MSEDTITREQEDDSSVRRSAVVTGSSRGIGRAVVSMLAEKGYDVCVNHASSGSRQEAEDLANELAQRYGVSAFNYQANVASSEETQSMLTHAKERFGRVDVLVNNAGITRDGLLARMKEVDFDDVIDINLKGVFNCCKAAAGFMMKQRYGRIITMGSVVGLSGNAGQVNYAASKAGIIGLSKSLAKELAPRNITVNVVAPGFIETDMTQCLSEKQQTAIMDRIAAKRFGSPEEVAALVAFLAGEQAAYVTGQVIGIDGGMSL